MKFPRFSSWSALTLLGLLAATVPTAQAWTGMGPKWPTSTNKYDKSALPSNWQSVADFATAQWTNVTPSPFNWVSDASSANDLTRGNIDGAGRTLAVTTIYYSGSRITRFVMKFDTSENWYLGSGSPGSNQVDGQSVATHEFGHAHGQGHAQSQYCSGSGSATLCPYYTMGTTYMRSLEADDRNGINTLYP